MGSGAAPSKFFIVDGLRAISLGSDKSLYLFCDEYDRSLVTSARDPDNFIRYTLVVRPCLRKITLSYKLPRTIPVPERRAIAQA